MFGSRTQGAQQGSTSEGAEGVTGQPHESSIPSALSQGPSTGPVGSQSPTARTPDVPFFRGVRPSRASSVVSTRTGISIGTLQDDNRSARSIDLSLGGRLFHINRDASKISVSDETQLPPYSPPAPSYSQIAESLPPAIPELPGTLPAASFQHTRSRPVSQPPPTSAADTASAPNVSAEEEEGSVYRSLSFNPGPDRISVAPKRRSASEGNKPDRIDLRSSFVNTTNPRLRRRNGVRLPKLFTNVPNKSATNLSTGGAVRSSDTPSPNTPIVHSAGPSFSRHELQGSVSPINTGSVAASSAHSPQELEAFPSVSGRQEEANRTQLSPPTLIVSETPAEVEEGDVRTEQPPAMDSENDISIHYSRIIRTIDHDHRKALHARDKELAVMRERLNEVDQVYRKLLKGKDFTIDDLQKRLTNLQEQTQTLVDKAQNAVEDQWEVRWKHRDRHLVERMRRIELESQKEVEQAVAKRDEEWVEELKKQNFDLFGKLGIDTVVPPSETGD